MTIRARWEGAARLLAGARDVLDARPGGGAGDALAARGWGEFLASLDDAAVDAWEIGGSDVAWPADAPRSLSAFGQSVRAVCDVPSLPDAAVGEGATTPRRHETPRKQAQIDAFTRVVLPIARGARRVVDVGSGHGHLTREIAERIAMPVVGLERDVALAARARGLVSDGAVAFATTDVIRDGLALEDGDCAIGLHACGELGDAIVVSAARRGASVALVGCCLQKRSAPSRAPLCDSPEFEGKLDLPRGILGLSNLTPRDVGVEATRAENLAARERRLALHRLLSQRDPSLSRGAEIDGLNRRAAQRDLPSLVARAFTLRSQRVPPRTAIDEAAAWAHEEHARERRASIPRSLLARALEVFVLLDRALYLEQRGFDVRVGVLFPTEVSARNLALVATRRAASAR